MNNALNMQLIERLASIEVDPLTVADWCKASFSAMQAQLGAGLTLFRLRGNTLVSLVTTTDTDQKPEPLTAEEYPSVFALLDSNQPQVDGTDIDLPIKIEGTSYGVLRIHTSDPTKIEGVNWKLIQSIFARELQRVILHELQITLDTVTTRLKDAKTFGDAVHTLAKHIAKSKQFLTLTIVELKDGTIQKSSIVASANRSQSYENVDALDRTSDTNVKFIVKVRSEQIVAVNDIHKESLFSSKTVEWLEGINVKAILLVNVDTEDNKVCYISYCDTQNAIALLPAESRFWTAVAAQVSKVLTSRNMIETQLEKDAPSANALTKISSVFSQTVSDEKMLLDQGAEILLNILPIDHVGIVLIDDERKYANLISDQPKLEGSVTQIPFEGDLWEKLVNERHVLISDVDTELSSTDTSRQALDGMNVKSVLMLPLIDQSGTIMGSAGLDKITNTSPFTEEQIQLAGLITSQISIQLQNHRLLRDSQKLATQMQHLAKFSETVQTRFDLDEILFTSLHFIRRIFDYDFADIVVMNTSSQTLQVQAYLQGTLENVASKSETIVMPLQGTVAEIVWDSRESSYIEDWEISGHQHPIAKDVHSLLAVPMITKGKIHGIVELGSASKTGISETDRSVFTQFASQLATAIENSVNYAQNQKLVHNRDLANDIALQLQRQMDMDGLLNTTVQELGKALGARRARIRLGIQQTANGN